MARHVIANRVFVAYPWRTYRPFWETLVADLHRRYPLHFLAIGREPGQPAAQLLERILDALNGSSAALFDASGGNANVSLEYGYAKATMAERTIFVFLDEQSTVSTAAGSPIISDLAGTIANRYTLNDTRLREAVERITRNHPFVRRWERFCRQRRYRGGTRRFLLRIVRQFDGHDSILRRELLDSLVHETRRSEDYVSEYLRALHDGGLVSITRGGTHGSRVALSG